MNARSQGASPTLGRKNEVFHLYAALLVFVLACFSTDIAICSFNIQFLGHFKDRDNAALASVLENYDIVVIQELGIPVTHTMIPKGAA